jgi:hypothetical protein
MLYTFQLPKTSPLFKHTSTRRQNGHSLGTLKTGDKMKVNFLPLPKYSSHYPPTFTSLCLSSQNFLLDDEFLFFVVYLTMLSRYQKT